MSKHSVGVIRESLLQCCINGKCLVLNTDTIACRQFASATGFLGPIYKYIASLNQEFGLSTSGSDALVLEKLIKLHKKLMTEK
jgi:hypothetical protein